MVNKILGGGAKWEVELDELENRCWIFTEKKNQIAEIIFSCV